MVTHFGNTLWYITDSIHKMPQVLLKLRAHDVVWAVVQHQNSEQQEIYEAYSLPNFVN